MMIPPHSLVLDRQVWKIIFSPPPHANDPRHRIHEIPFWSSASRRWRNRRPSPSCPPSGPSSSSPPTHAAIAPSPIGRTPFILQWTDRFFHQQRGKITLAEIQYRDQHSTVLQPETVLAQLEHSLVETRPQCLPPVVLRPPLLESTSGEFLLGVATIMQEGELLTGVLVAMGVLAAACTKLRLYVVLLHLLSPALTQKQLVFRIEEGEAGLPHLLEGPSHERIRMKCPLQDLQDDRGISVCELSQDVVEEGELNGH